MYRLNVAALQLEECIQRGLFALTYKPQIEPGEILLLQLNKRDWKSLEQRSGRIQYALVFQNLERDKDGSISKLHWPNASKTWEWILHASQVVEIEPFSLEDLPLHRESHYQA